ncbi:hypothetical protein BTA51_13885 [Hahella sp. CCB-MM4]|uniref:DUF6928 family protein n=1 Tax=Hahella sp. (strain CCB-MM4) TaxID=1926491 RepID=UPI000B9C2AF5|nr:hypothetical protein [Hahella sp. CCB-MM4]OZG72615.1 hypothetical protein BTA51_13885 [Hahella sp. CCB-MM4]
MGAKTWMLVCSDDAEPSRILKQVPNLNREKTDELVKELFPKDKLEPIEDGSLSYTNPPDDILYAGCFEGVTVLAAKEFALDFPTKLDARFVGGALGRFAFSHAMHSAVDWLAFSKWENGKLLRALSLSPDSDILEDVGERLPFEIPFWEGKHPATDPEDDEADYPFAFHPLELGEEALKAFFGYQLEGYIDESLLEPEEIPLVGYRRVKKKWKLW